MHVDWTLAFTIPNAQIVASCFLVVMHGVHCVGALDIPFQLYEAMKEI